jgi:hypothetical protein
MILVEEDLEMLNGSILIMKNLYNELRGLDLASATLNLKDMDEKKRKLYERKDGKDTLEFDVVAEDAIFLGRSIPGHSSLIESVYGKSGISITEERGRIPRKMRIEHDTPVIISDPFDGGSHMEDYIKRNGDGCETLGEVLDIERKLLGEERAMREACNSSVTLLKDNTIKYTVIMNILTGELFVGYPRGVYSADVTKVRSIEDLNKPVRFSDNENLKMICYTLEGKYENNRIGTHLRFFPLDKRAHEKPIGALRFSYLVEHKGKPSGVGVVAHNGEKIQELLPNVSIALFSKGGLQAYKLFCDPELSQERKNREMTPVIANSLYSCGLLHNTGIKSSFLNNYDYPSEFRDTTVIVPVNNEPAVTMMTGMVERNYAVRIV